MHRRPWLWGGPALALALLIAGTAHAAKASKAVVMTRLTADVTFLASDECEGRGPTTEGINRAADYIANQFKEIGLKPGAKDGYFQPFTLPVNLLDAPATLTLKGPLGQTVELEQGEHYWPFGLGSAGSGEDVPVVFAGYGISAGSLGYDDYAGLDVKGKVVAVLRGAPRGEGNRRHPLAQLAPFVKKIETAREKGAVGVIVVNDRAGLDEGDQLLDFEFTALESGPAKLPAFHVKRSVLGQMLSTSAEDLDTVERRMAHHLEPHGLALEGWRASFEVKMHRGQVTLKNVVGVLEGVGPLAKETVVVGAHYDHLGYGGGRGSLANLRGPAIHNGADDNASGTTAMIELARRFAEAEAVNRRRLVFMAFSGEELGLLGSKHYVKEPLFPLEDTAAMFNLDMVGRLDQDKESGKDKLLVEGAGSGKPFDALVEDLNKKYGFHLAKAKEMPPNSDHYSFYTKQVPVMFFWTGVHRDYHRPSDDADKINVEGMTRIIDMSEEVVGWMATRKERPEYVKMPLVRRQPSSGPRLGIVPGYGDSGEGLLVDGVSPGGPAAAAGIKEGDRVVEIGGKQVTNINTYMQAMSGQKKGTTIDVGVLREGKKVMVKVKLE